mgnify:CR=1 FL=1
MAKTSVLDLKKVKSNVKGIVEAELAATGGLLRLAPHWPNGMHEIPFVVEKTAEALRSAERPRD